jgi:monovalent cation/hydrogen antiporter
VFLTMGVQLDSIVTSVERDHAGVGTAVLVAAGALALTVAVRAAFVAPLLAGLARGFRHGMQMQERLQGMQDKMGTTEGRQESFAELNTRRGRRASERDLDRFALRVTRVLADIEYFRREPLGWREGTAVVWAGMRGAVTVAAAQTLPEDTPQRSVLVLVAFAVAALSLLVQGGTIGPVLRLVAPVVDRAAVEAQDRADVDRIFELLRSSAETVPEPPARAQTPESFEVAKEHRLAVIAAQRAALLDARDNGTFDAEVLAKALANLDASQIAIEIRGSLAV